MKGVELMQNAVKNRIGIEGFVARAVLVPEAGQPEARAGIARRLRQFGVGANAARAPATLGIHKRLRERRFPWACMRHGLQPSRMTFTVAAARCGPWHVSAP